MSPAVAAPVGAGRPGCLLGPLGASVCESVACDAGFDDPPAKVRRSTKAAQSFGSANVFVQPENASLDAIAMADFSSRSVKSWNSSSAPRLSSSI